MDEEKFDILRQCRMENFSFEIRLEDDPTAMYTFLNEIMTRIRMEDDQLEDDNFEEDLGNDILLIARID